MNELSSMYHDWLCDLVSDGFDFKNNYSMLLKALDSKSFTYIHPMDSNRYADGVDMRYRFGDEYNIPDSVICEELDIRDCSVLEMMVALSVRCEEAIMHDPDKGDTTHIWFQTMLKNLGIICFTDSSFDAHRVDYAIDRFLDRRYDSHGDGGLFYVQDPPDDMRNIDIWYQMCHYLNESIL